MRDSEWTKEKKTPGRFKRLHIIYRFFFPPCFSLIVWLEVEGKGRVFTLVWWKSKWWKRGSLPFYSTKWDGKKGLWKRVYLLIYFNLFALTIYFLCYSSFYGQSKTWRKGCFTFLPSLLLCVCVWNKVGLSALVIIKKKKKKKKG